MEIVALVVLAAIALYVLQFLGIAVHEGGHWLVDFFNKSVIKGNVRIGSGQCVASIKMGRWLWQLGSEPFGGVCLSWSARDRASFKYRLQMNALSAIAGPIASVIYISVLFAVFYNCGHYYWEMVFICAIGWQVHGLYMCLRCPKNENAVNDRTELLKALQQLKKL